MSPGVSPGGPVPSYTHVLDKLQFSGPHIRKDKNRGSSRFNISQKRDIQKLPLLKGTRGGGGLTGRGGGKIGRGRDEEVGERGGEGERCGGGDGERKR